MMVEPKLRFKADDGSDFPDWEEKVVEDVCSVTTGNSNTQDRVDGGQYPFYIRSATPVRSNRYLFDTEAVITIGDGQVGQVFHYVKGKFDLHQRCYAMFDFKENTIGKYFYYFFSSHFYKRVMRMSAKATVDSVRREMITKMLLQLPSLPEQRKIADLLSAVDDVIAAQEAEVAAWEKRKKGVMQKLFSQEVRFKADDGSDFPDWDEKALSEIAARVTRKNKGNQTDIPLTISSLDGLVDQRDYFKKTVASKDMSGYFLLRNGEFAYNKSYSVGFDYGSIKRLDKYPCGALSTLYICFGLKPNVKVDSGYLAHYFDSQKWNPEVAAICAEGARNHGLLNVPTADFFDINIAVPSLPEQRKIADCLISLDDVIVKAKDELDAWRELKKGLLQQMFV